MGVQERSETLEREQVESQEKRLSMVRSFTVMFLVSELAKKPFYFLTQFMCRNFARISHIIGMLTHVFSNFS